MIHSILKYRPWRDRQAAYLAYAERLKGKSDADSPSEGTGVFGPMIPQCFLAYLLSHQ